MSSRVAGLGDPRRQSFGAIASPAADHPFADAMAADVAVELSKAAIERHLRRQRLIPHDCTRRMVPDVNAEAVASADIYSALTRCRFAALTTLSGRF